MPQTVEAHHAQAARVGGGQIEEGANPAKIRQQLTEYNLVAEEYGGNTMFVDISATSTSCSKRSCSPPNGWTGPAANPNMEAQASAIKAHLDRGRGPVGRAERGARGWAATRSSRATASGRVRRMFDEYGGDIVEAYPSAWYRVPRCPAPATPSWDEDRVAGQ